MTKIVRMFGVACHTAPYPLSELVQTMLPFQQESPVGESLRISRISTISTLPAFLCRYSRRTYDAFIDPSKWPDDEERSQLASIYGWPEPTHQESEVPYGPPRVPSQKVSRRLDS